MENIIDKLKPCPFCGSKYIEIKDNKEFEEFVKKENGVIDKNEYIYEIWCNYCNARIECYEAGTKKETIDWWNKRAKYQDMTKWDKLNKEFYEINKEE